MDHVEAINEDDHPLKYPSETAEFKTGSQDLQGDIYRAKQELIETSMSDHRAKRVIIKAAEDDSDSIKKRAQIEIEREKEKAINSLKDEIVTIAIMAASKVVEKDLDVEAHESYVKQFIDEVGDAKWQN